MKTENSKRTLILFVVTLALAVACLGLSVVKTNAYNKAHHNVVFAGPDLFAPEDVRSKEVYVEAVPRSSTWGKVFDFNNEGLTENNYQAYTYDFTVSNNTKDEVADFKFKLTFSKKGFINVRTIASHANASFMGTLSSHGIALPKKSFRTACKIDGKVITFSVAQLIAEQKAAKKAK